MRPGLKAASLALGCLFGLVLLEVGARVMFPPKLALDDRLGWRPETESGRLDETAFRSFGDPAAARAKLLVLGDSFTYARGIPPEKTYYGILGRELPAEVFAFGGEGYATLQESMVYEDFSDRVAPHIVLWQLHEDDLCGNSYECERLDWNMAHDNGLRRPYLGSGGEVIYATPSFPRLPAPLGPAIDAVRRVSRLADVVFHRVALMLRKTRPAPTDKDRETGQRMTRTILAKASRRRLKRETSIYAFASAGPEDVFQAACRESGVEFIPLIGKAVREAAGRGEPVYAPDGIHWSEVGHAIVARELKAYLRKRRPAAAPAKRPRRRTV